MARNIWDADHRCICGSAMKKKMMKIEGMETRVWECNKCKDVVLHPEDAQKMLVFNKLKKGIPVKIGELGESLIMRFPKEVAEFYNITKGGEIILRAETEKKMEIAI